MRGLGVLTTLLDLLGLALLAAFAWYVWAPASLAVLGLGALVVSFQLTSRAANRQRVNQ